MTNLATAARTWTQGQLEARVVRYSDLVPCLNAFIDTRTPGSETKENFTIIGPGVSENPDQHVHIAEPHGFNVGGARQPPGCVNSQHSHNTAEVFVVHSGRWSFDFGEHADDANIEAGPGDVVSFPVHAFRGFRNVGDDVGFLWSVLGGDDPGRVTWAPKVFDMAADYGLVLLADGALVDTAAGQSVRPGATPMPKTTPAQVATMRRLRNADAPEVIARAADLALAPETPVIGNGGPLPAADGFALSRLLLGGGETVTSDDAEVIFVQQGTLTIDASGTMIALAAGDTMTVPPHLPHNYGSERGATAFVVRAA